MTATVTIHDSITALVAAESPWETAVARDFDPPHRFISRTHRDDHVRKHVLEARHERWHQLLDPDALESARDDPRNSEAFAHLAREYESILSTVLEEALQPPRRAARLIRFELAPPTADRPMFGGYVPDRRSIVAWCPDRRIRVIAGFPVSSPGVTSYRLLSGFRHDLRGSPSRFTQAIHHRLLDRVHRSQERLVDDLPRTGLPGTRDPRDGETG